MSAVWPAILCPACAEALDEDRAGAACPRCTRRYGRAFGQLDLRLAPEARIDPDPLPGGGFGPAFAVAARGAPYKQALEQLLLALPDGHAAKLMQLLREARATWMLLGQAPPGDALLLGNALSGSATPLAAAGSRVTQLERSPERARFAALRNQAHSPGGVRVLLGGDGERLPFADGVFDLVVIEDGLPGRAGGVSVPLSEAQRVCRGELVLIADNRLGYKRSSGARSDFRVPGPLEYLRGALRPAAGERSLAGYRRRLSGRGFVRARAFALYPHRHDFTHVVTLDGAWPKLTVGPLERRNQLKLLGRALGLFPLLTPSFALLAPRREISGRRTRIARVLGALARHLGEREPGVELLIGTRGNTAIVHTRLPGAAEEQPEGCWTLHVPLTPRNVPAFRLHIATLRWVRERFPFLPVPEPLFEGRVDGVWLTCERRLPGLTGPQLGGDGARSGRMLRDAARDLARLVVAPPRPLLEADLVREIDARFELVGAHASTPSVAQNLELLQREIRERLAGAQLARVLQHADLRGKHLQVDREGRILGYLDWGTAERSGLPYFDLLHLMINERKQQQGGSVGAAWRSFLDEDGRSADERAAIGHYCQAVGLSDDAARALEQLYPVLVAAVAERNWDYSRPRWLQQQLGL